jgi:hypothetical protein
LISISFARISARRQRPKMSRGRLPFDTQIYFSSFLKASSSKPRTIWPPRITTGRRMRFGTSAINLMAWARVGGFSFIFLVRYSSFRGFRNSLKSRAAINVSSSASLRRSLSKSRESSSAPCSSKKLLALRQVVQVGFSRNRNLIFGMILSQYRGTFGSTSADQRSMPPAIDFAFSTPCCRNHTAASRLRIPW